MLEGASKVAQSPSLKTSSSSSSRACKLLLLSHALLPLLEKYYNYYYRERPQRLVTFETFHLSGERNGESTILQKMALNTAHANGGVLIHAGERWNNSQTQKVFSKLMFNALQHSSFLRQCHHGVCRPGTDCEHGHNACFWVLFYFVDCFYH